MWGNWLNNFDPFDYEQVKKSANDYNKKIVKFWKDAFADVSNFWKSL
jgi:hypothetical protein